MKLLGPDEIHEAAYIEACERDSPNSIGFDALCENIAERMFIQQDARLDSLHHSLTRALNECIGMLSVGLSALNKTEGDTIRVQVMRERAEVCIDILRKQVEALKD